MTFCLKEELELRRLVFPTYITLSKKYISNQFKEINEIVYKEPSFTYNNNIMELNIDDEWSQFLSSGGEQVIDDVNENVNLEEINTLLTCPKATDIYISTKTNISFLNTNIDLTTIFWKIPIIRYGMPTEGIVKKQMKFNFTSRDELNQMQEHLKFYTCVEENIITSIDNPSGRIKFKDIRKVSIGLCKKDILNYRSKKKSAFYNCFVMIVRLKEDSVYKEYHVKVFNTGKLEIPGIQSDDTFYKVLDIVVEILKPHTNDNLQIIHDKTHTVLINSNFNCGFYVKREALFNILKVKYNIACIYDPCSYPGIQCKFFYYTQLDEQTGVQQSHLSDDVEVSFMIFRTGSVLIVGKCNEDILRFIYQFLTNVLVTEFNQIAVKLIDANEITKQKVTKIRKKIINI